MSSETQGVVTALPAILEASGEAIASLNSAGKVVGCNSRFQDLLGLDVRCDVQIREYIADFFPDENKIEKISDYQAFLLKRSDASEVWVLIKVIPVGNEELNYYTVFIQEPDTFRRIIDRLDYIENFDQETGLWSCRKGMVEFEQLLVSQLSGGVFLVKIDSEDEQGITDLINKLAPVFSFLGEEHFVSRYAVDQILIVYTSDKPLSVESFHILIESVKHKEIISPGINIRLSFADWMSGSLSVNTLLDYLQSSLRQIDDPGILQELRDQERQSTHTAFVNSLQKALDNGEFTFFIQPQVSAQTRLIVGGELLVRWIPGSGRIIAPSEYINFLEEGDFSYSFYTWSIFKAMETLSKLKQSLGRWVPLSLNLAPTHIRDRNLVEMLVNVVHEHEIPTSILEVEITERILAKDQENILANLIFLADNGINIAIDDFGTGYSSLSYLRKFPLDRLKIDRIFISNLNENEEDRLIVSSIISLAHVLGLEVVAEGVEEASQIAFLNETGCEYLQGYFTSKPIPINAFVDLLSNDKGGEEWEMDGVSLVKDHHLGKQPKPVKWKKSFSTDLVSIDEEHRVLVDVLNNFSSAYHKDPGSVDVLETLDLIATETIKHFEHEETVMYNIKYPRYKAHKSKHEDLIADIARRRNEYEKNIDDIDFDEVIRYLKYWLLRHLVSEDTHLRRYLNKEKFDRRT